MFTSALPVSCFWTRPPEDRARPPLCVVTLFSAPCLRPEPGGVLGAQHCCCRGRTVTPPLAFFLGPFLLGGSLVRGRGLRVGGGAGQGNAVFSDERIGRAAPGWRWDKTSPSLSQRHGAGQVMRPDWGERGHLLGAADPLGARVQGSEGAQGLRGVRLPPGHIWELGTALPPGCWWSRGCSFLTPGPGAPPPQGTWPAVHPGPLGWWTGSLGD